MEVSSHALALHRCDSIHFEIAVFMNLTQDHLDFHNDMSDYFAAKRLLFEAGPATAIVNVDDVYGRKLAEEFECLTFSSAGREANFYAADQKLSANGASFTINEPAGARSHPPIGVVKTQLPGDFNVSNAVAAFAAATQLDGVEPAQAAAGLSQADPPPGRIEPIDEGQPFAVFVDYAHTPDSLENVLRAARSFSDKRVIVVIGAGGDRDKDKRPKMGRAAARGADFVFFTSDNPRSEDPLAIIAEVKAGAEGANADAVADRREAIAQALAYARPGDTVVIAGKGHEQGQEFEGGRKIPFDDREVARQELRRLARAEPA